MLRYDLSNVGDSLKEVKISEALDPSAYEGKFLKDSKGCAKFCNEENY